jgi:hypothetical protein
MNFRGSSNKDTKDFRLDVTVSDVPIMRNQVAFPVDNT